jgi:catechol 2,3-dioxygenase-like lactoylglutathione lyase family enzyme
VYHALLNAAHGDDEWRSQPQFVHACLDDDLAQLLDALYGKGQPYIQPAWSPQFKDIPTDASLLWRAALGHAMEKKLHHFLVEARSMDEVGLAFDRALKAGVRVVLTPGRHPNDRMFSFYARTPSGFEFEFGWGGREVDDATWTPTTYHQISEWGHHPPQLFAARRSPTP